MADKRAGIAFQTFVASVERAYANRNDVVVESPKVLVDADTGTNRDFDVFLTAKFGGYHEVTTAIEVKDKKRPIGLEEVEAFIAKCGRNNISRKVMVSPKGASAPAQTLALRAGISIMTMAEAKSFDWLATDVIFNHERTFGQFDFSVEVEGELPTPGDWELLGADGQVVEPKRLMIAIKNSVPPDPSPSQPITTPKAVEAEFEEKFTVRLRDGTLIAVRRVLGRTSYTSTVSTVPFKLHTYRGSGASEGVDLSFAAADFQIGEVTGKVFVARRQDGSTRVSWQPAQTNVAEANCDP